MRVRISTPPVEWVYHGTEGASSSCLELNEVPSKKRVTVLDSIFLLFRTLSAEWTFAQRFFRYRSIQQSGKGSLTMNAHLP